MALQFYNTLTRKKEEFQSIPPNEARIYACGPTVYNYVHLGNLRAYMFYDLVVRYLRYKGYKVNFVSNITDVDDKTIRDSQKENLSLKEFTQKYTDAYLEDLKILNITIPDEIPKATEYIEKMVDMIKKLVEKGIAYEKNGSYYYKIDKFKNYGELANLDIKGLKENADGRLNQNDEYEKDNARDFALWKAYEESDGEIFWETSLGKGRPGWHIECSVMSFELLGCPFDIHMGGVDLIFPHHTNEIAQTEGALDCKYVNYWLHNAHLIVNGEKMSKSLGNFYTLRDLMEKGYNPKAIRYQLLATHYRQKLNFTEDALKQIPSTLQRFYDFLDKLADIKSGDDNPEIDEIINSAKEAFEDALDDDLNISAALAAIFDFMKNINKLIADNKVSESNAKDVKHFMERIDTVLSVFEHEKAEIPGEVLDMVNKREEARKSKDYALADKIRDEIIEKGYILEDTPEGIRVKKNQ